jgi:hypothetical protein
MRPGPGFLMQVSRLRGVHERSSKARLQQVQISHQETDVVVLKFTISECLRLRVVRCEHSHFKMGQIGLASEGARMVVDRQSGTANWPVEPCLSTEARIIIAALHLSSEKAKLTQHPPAQPRRNPSPVLPPPPT